MADFKHSLGFNISSEGALVKPTKYQTQGFTAGYKLPAPHFNWIVDKTSKAIDEIHEFLTAKSLKAGVDLNQCTGIGMYVYSSADSASIGNTPEKAQSTLLVLPRLLPNDTANRVQVVITQTNTLYIRNRTGSTWEKWTQLRKTTDIVPIKYGGTEATNVTDARKNLDLPETCVQITDWNEATKTGWYMANNAENAPTINEGGTAWYFGFVIAHATGYVYQEVYQFSASASAILVPKYIRAQTAGTWGQWYDVTVQRTVPQAAKMEFIKNLTSDAQEQFNNKMNKNPDCIEIIPAKDTNNGGHIDFHFGGSDKDYTSRIIEESESVLLMRAALKVEGNLYENLNNRVYSTGHKPTPAEIGAVPIGYGFAESAKFISNTSLVDVLSTGKSGFYKGTNVTGAPTTDEWWIFEIICHDEKYATVMAYQEAGTDVYHMFYRGGVLGNWYKVHTSAEAIPIENGGTGATNVINARANLNFKSGYYMGDGNSAGANHTKDLGCPNSNLIFIYANSGGNDFYGFLNPNGGFMIDVWRGALGGQQSEIYYFGSDADQKASYANGVLAIRSNSDYLNANNVKYSYQCL